MPPKTKIEVVAEAKIFQVALSGVKGKTVVVAVYLCGDDAFYAENMDGLFSEQRRRKLPKYLLDQLTSDTPTFVNLDYRGRKIVANKSAEMTKVQFNSLEGVELDEDGIAQG